jgi:general secretion pathway protein G
MARYSGPDLQADQLKRLGQSMARISSMTAKQPVTKQASMCCKQRRRHLVKTGACDGCAGIIRPRLETARSGCNRPGGLTCQRGITLLELLLVLAILGVLASIAVVAYDGYIDTAKISNAEKQIRMISLAIDDYYTEYRQYPVTLADVNLDNLKDPWGNPYHYLNIAAAGNIGGVRKDHNLVPLNTDYDLYSSGKDGISLAPLTAKASLDDIVRANNGGFVGLATNY